MGVSDGVHQHRFFVYERNDKVSLLEFIQKKLRTTHYVLRTLLGIIVVPGPGGFSNVRSAVTLANALGFALGIALVVIKPKEDESAEALFGRGIRLVKRTKSVKIVQPVYGKEPNITFPNSPLIKTQF